MRIAMPRAIRDLILAVGAGIAVHRVLSAVRRGERRHRRPRAFRWLRRLGLARSARHHRSSPS
jgi:hypothetical protein